MSLILGFDTATPTASVAIFDRDAGQVVGRADEPVQTHGKALMMLVDRVMSDAGARKTDLDALVCGLGPGSFTGVRVGLATAKGICFALDIPLIGGSSLRALAGRVVEDSASADLSESPVREVLLPCLDARRGEVYLAAYWNDSLADPSRAAEPSAAPWIGPLAVPPARVGETLHRSLTQWVSSNHEPSHHVPRLRFRVLGTGVELVGDRWADVEALLAGQAEVVCLADTDPWPDAGFLAREGALLLDRGTSLDLDGAQPIYLRPSDAEENFGLDLSPKS